MNIKKQNVFNLMIVGMLLIFVSKVYAERSWDNKTENENIGWEQKVENWNQFIKTWSKNRDNLHEQYFGDKYDKRGKHCNESTGECWEEGIFDLVYAKNGQEIKFEKERGDTEVVFLDKSKWECINGGQVLRFYGTGGESWESGNYGQVIDYKNARGDHWESRNIGQSVIFEGANGEKWESHNHGQVVEHMDTNGNTWSGSDNDMIDNMR